MAAIERATAASWPDGRSVVALRLAGPAPDPDDLRRALGTRGDPGRVETARPLPSATVTFDESASPWHTVAVIEWPAEEGSLASLAAAVLRSGAVVHGAVVGNAGSCYRAVLDLTDEHGGRLDAARQSALAEALRRGGTPAGQRRRALRRTRPRQPGRRPAQLMYACSAWSRRSRPSSSTAGVTRRPIVMSMTLPMIRLTTKE